MPPTDYQAQIAAIRALPEQIAELTAGLSPAQLTGHFLAGEWSVAQNVHHLADSHMNAYIRCRLIATEQEPPLKPYAQERWAELPDATVADLSASLALLRGLHARWSAFWEQLPDEAWQRAGLHAEYGRMTLADILRSYAAHGLGHIDQIERTLAAQP